MKYQYVQKFPPFSWELFEVKQNNVLTTAPKSFAEYVNNLVLIIAVWNYSLMQLSDEYWGNIGQQYFVCVLKPSSLMCIPKPS